MSALKQEDFVELGLQCEMYMGSASPIGDLTTQTGGQGGLFRMEAPS